MLIKLAWRNLWRNKRRTMLTVSSIAFAVLIAVIMRGFQLGTYDSMIENTLGATTGHIQIQHENWWDDKTIDNIFVYSDDLRSVISQESKVQSSAPRFQNFALVSFGNHTKGVPVFGIEPLVESQVSGLDEQIVQGTYLERNDQESLISTDLAEYLGVSVGDSIVLFGQGYHGVTAVGKYRIKGVFDYSFSALGNSVVYLSLSSTQQLYGAEGKLTSLSLTLKHRDLTEKVITELSNNLPKENIVASSWETLNKALLDNIRADDVSGQIMIGVLYMVIGFGIFGTLLMMAAERRREFSVMNSIGMKRSRIMQIVITETLMLAAVAVVVGMVLSVPVNIYFHFNPIRFTGEMAKLYEEYNMEPVMRMSAQPDYIINQAVIVLLLSLGSLAAPINVIRKLNVVNTLRGR